MQVSDIMTPKVITINETQSLLEVRELMANNNLRRVPVVNDIGVLKGIITDGDVSRSAPSDASTLSKYEANYLMGKLKVKDIMKKTVITVKANDAIETIAYLLYKNKIGAIPVIDENSKVCGIVSDTDVFKVLVDILGYAQNSTKITIDATDKVGVLAELADIFKKRGVNIISIVTREMGGTTREILIRADLTNSMDIIEEIRDAGLNITDISTLKV